MTAPARLQLSRRKGFDLQALSLATNGLPAVNVARPTMWGNPFTIASARDAGYQCSDHDLARMVVREFRAWISPSDPFHPLKRNDDPRRFARRRMLEDLHQLRGKNLACWCALGSPCHADVLIEIANRPICEDVA